MSNMIELKMMGHTVGQNIYYEKSNERNWILYMLNACQALSLNSVLHKWIFKSVVLFLIYFFLSEEKLDWGILIDMPWRKMLLYKAISNSIFMFHELQLIYYEANRVYKLKLIVKEYNLRTMFSSLQKRKDTINSINWIFELDYHFWVVT